MGGAWCGARRRPPWWKHEAQRTALMVSLSGVSGEPRWLWSDMLGGCSCLFCVTYIVLIVVVCVVINPSSILIQNVLCTLLKKKTK
jgi:hypothetical protein